MQIKNIIIPERVYFSIPLKSKKKALEFIAHSAASAYPGLLEEEIFEALIARERLGSTVLEHGIALPHARLPRLQEPFGLFIQLREGIPFDDENSKIDLIFALFVPEAATEAHLHLLAQIAEKLGNETIRHNLRQAASVESLYEQLCN